MDPEADAVSAIRDAGMRDCARLCRILSDAGVPSAVGGVNAASHYGGGLCPLDIEIIVDDCDQERVFQLMASHGVHPAVPVPDDEGEGSTTGSPSSQVQVVVVVPRKYRVWRQQQLAPAYRFRDRCRVRIATPIYKLPATGDATDDYLLPFLIFYSAEAIGLGAKLHHPGDSGGHDDGAATIAAPPASSSPRFCEVGVEGWKAVPDGHGGSSSSAPACCLVPDFVSLVQSEMHIVLVYAEFHSPVWGQHMSQLSELLRSRSCPYGLEGLPRLVCPELLEFADWVTADLMGAPRPTDELDGIRSRYVESHFARTGWRLMSRWQAPVSVSAPGGSDDAAVK